MGQHTSVGNYWNDPHHQTLYYNYSQFLPYVNNEIQSTRSKDFKLGLTKLNKMILIGVRMMMLSHLGNRGMKHEFKKDFLWLQNRDRNTYYYYYYYFELEKEL